MTRITASSSRFGADPPNNRIFPRTAYTLEVQALVAERLPDHYGTLEGALTIRLTQADAESPLGSIFWLWYGHPFW